MEYEITLEYTTPLLREGVTGYWRRSVGDATLIALPIAAGMLGFLLLRGDRSGMTMFLAAALLLFATFVVAVPFVLYRNAVQKLRELGASRVVLRVSEDSLTVGAGATTLTAPWSSVKEAWKFKNCWLLLFSKTQFMNLPMASVPEEKLAFVLKRIAAAGGKIDG